MMGGGGACAVLGPEQWMLYVGVVVGPGQRLMYVGACAVLEPLLLS
jgi:hypothetical protein